jgi:hypothetical protein
MAYIHFMGTITPVAVIETPSFLRDAKFLMDDEDREKIVVFLAYNPKAGDVLNEGDRRRSQDQVGSQGWREERGIQGDLLFSLGRHPSFCFERFR